MGVHGMPNAYKVLESADGQFVVEREMPDGRQRFLKRTYATKEGADRRAAELNLRYKYVSDALNWRVSQTGRVR